MSAFRRFPALLSLLLLAAHFLRSGNLLLIILVLGVLVLLFLPWRWARVMVQAALALGAVEWLRTLAVLAKQRREFGQPYLRMMLILGAVAAFSALSAWLLEARHHSLEQAADET